MIIGCDLNSCVDNDTGVLMWTGSCKLSPKEDAMEFRTLMTVLEDLDYADDIGLLSSQHQDAQQKAEHLSKTASTVGLKVNTKKTQVLRKNTGVIYPVMIDGRHLEDVDWRL